MTQRPRLSQLKRNNINFRTFQEQYEKLEQNAQHIRKPVRTRGELPFDGNIDGTKCLVIDEGVEYYWDENIQNWQPILGQVFRVENQKFQRWKKHYVAKEGQTDFVTDITFDVEKNHIDVYVQGILQDEGIDYIELDNRTIRFLTPIPKDAIVTIATPMVVEYLTDVETLIERLEDLEYNNYQLMLNQYYDGKEFEAQGMVYDGFLNTSQIDYVMTSTNILYDPIRKSMYMRHEEPTGIVEQFDSTNNIAPESTVYIRDLEMTLPISTNYESAFIDDFSTNELIDWNESDVYWDRERKWVTNDDTYSGGSNYYRGDFMTRTGNADLVGFNEDIKVYAELGYYSSYLYLNQYTNCFAVLAMGNMNAIINDMAIIYRNKWPYSGYWYFYSSSNVLYFKSDGTGYYDARSVWPTSEAHYRPATTYVREWNKIITLLQRNESSGRYYQQLYSSDGRTQNLIWSAHSRPNGMPKTTFGSETADFTGSKDRIEQIGSTYDRLLLRVKDVLYFLDNTFTVVKILDWTNAVRKPSLYNVVSQQITADKKYLYFPARLLRNGIWGYYLEVFSIEDGSFVNEILVTQDNAGIPGTTAMCFDHDYNRLILGQRGGNKYTLVNKDKNHLYESNSYAGMLIFEAPDLRECDLVSKPIVTNLPEIYYQLNAVSQLNNGTIDYYIRFDNNAWTKILPLTNYYWKNTKGAKETTIQLRAVFKSSLTATDAPILTSWQLNIRPFITNAFYKSKETLLNVDGIIGGSLKPNQTIPNETNINWYIKLDNNSHKIYAGKDSEFTIPLITGDAYFSVEAELSTNNKWMSPVVQNYKLQLYRHDEGVLVTETSRQINPINEVYIWVTTSHGKDYYEVDVSRDGGQTWEPAIKQNAVQLTNGNVETKWYHHFNEYKINERDFKIRFRLNGAVEIMQYGAKIN